MSMKNSSGTIGNRTRDLRLVGSKEVTSLFFLPELLMYFIVLSHAVTSIHMFCTVFSSA